MAYEAEGYEGGIGPIAVPRVMKKNTSKRDLLLEQADAATDPKDREYFQLAAALEDKYAQGIANAQTEVQQAAQTGNFLIPDANVRGAQIRRGRMSDQAAKDYDAAMEQLRQTYGKQSTTTGRRNMGSTLFYGG